MGLLSNAVHYTRKDILLFPGEVLRQAKVLSNAFLTHSI